MRYETIQNIVKAVGIGPGETVLVHFWGEEEDLEIAHGFLSAAAARGGSPILLCQSRRRNRALFAAATSDSFGDDYFRRFRGMDTVLDIFTYQPIVLGYPLPEEKMELYRNYIRRLFGALTESKRFVQLRIPTAGNAAESGLEQEAYIRRMEDAYDQDYAELSLRCSRAVQALGQHHRYVLRTGTNSALYLDFSDRIWHIDAGDGDWPCGEVYIAPREEATHGTVFFPQLWVEDVGKFENVCLFVQNGRLKSADSEVLQRWIHSLSPENRVICELGLGMNRKVTDLCGYTVLDEKMDGSFHIAIGANHLFGGENRADMHLDLVSDGAFSLEAE